jgi:phage baseplate assembly protein W
MPTSRSFKDISTTFDKNFVTNDLMVAKDFTAIKNSIRNLIMTTPSERFFNPTIGSKLSDQLFEPIDIITVNNIKEEKFSGYLQDYKSKYTQKQQQNTHR